MAKWDKVFTRERIAVSFLYFVSFSFAVKWNVTPLIRQWSNLFFFAARYCSCGTRDCNRGIKLKKGAINCCHEKKNYFTYTFWLSFDKRTELDIRLTNKFPFHEHLATPVMLHTLHALQNNEGKQDVSPCYPFP